ncbi:MAG: PmeII family type II restriction endonuclease, partial [Alphaproteobacteria bacterium]|nr:PmeII family type II restriction endonuclease [Alphaproteobacteria bacterium]
FRDTIAVNHIINTKKLSNPSEFNINPFLSVYLANFLCGNSDPQSIARALIYPRVLGTSITTSFGQNMQSFTSSVLSSFGSTTKGIDIEFTDYVDGEKKYCQLKAGPNTINKDDVESVAGHFKGIIHLARTNGLKVGFDNLIVGVLYGEEGDLSSHYKRITKDYHYSVVVGQDFWTRLTGDKEFYADLIKCIGEIANESNFSAELEDVVDALASSAEIINLSKEVSGS